MSNKRVSTKFIVVHSSQTTSAENLSAKDIDTLHRKDGLLSIGFHKIIKRDGTIEDGRNIDTCGVHVKTKGDVSNQNSIGVCLVGGKNSKEELDCNYTLAQFNSLHFLLVELKSHYGKVTVVGHRDVADTSCPSFEVSELGKFV
jgi:N-acetyl-anhydromuramyl-L-alanine amidase AmpD